MEQKAQLEQLIRDLEMFLVHPKMYFDDTLPPVINFLRGMLWGVRGTIDLTTYHHFYHQVQVERGWEVSAHVPVKQMVEKGLDSDQIAREFLLIELETWKRVISRG